ncbi:GGDEF domain-containing protein [Paenibacillus sp. sptzw28]|uniref:GGDEF domain-containing protein n=1 Tax=Paenibacillus sp. sptzw28 TaxID=715179 RepID=UPI001C6EB3FD|nr:GGDEF domain-containing protein [Paenibacillus sp. sptzw28]QYR20474.1 GGDEF domain-containing protein [Paenibacillus sp. sptzw28]
MDYESLDYNRYRWNRMLLTGFWAILIISLFLEGLYLTITEMPAGSFIPKFIVKPTILQLTALLFAETALKVLKGKYQDYILILTSALLAYILVYIHDSVNFLLLALFMPVIVSIFYFQPRKLVFALGNTLLSVYVMYLANEFMHREISLVGLTTITVMFSAFSLVAWGIIMRGRELMSNLKSYYESNQQLLVKTIWMDKMVKTDALTDLYNHMTFHEYFEKLIEQHEQHNLPLQLALIDIDNFKQINDTYGHRAGDSVLREVAEMIRSKANSNDFVARYGGEEFAMLFTDKSKADALSVVEQIRQKISEKPHDALGGKPVTVSIGFGEYTLGDGKERFFTQVDTALYKAKSSGKNKTVVAIESLESQLA